MSNRKKLDRTKLPISVAAIQAENARRAALPEPEEGQEKLEQLPSDRRSRRAMRRRPPVLALMAQAAGQHVHTEPGTEMHQAMVDVAEAVADR